jgi:hypothetical protein
VYSSHPTSTPPLRLRGRACSTATSSCACSAPSKWPLLVANRPSSACWRRF